MEYIAHRTDDGRKQSIQDHLMNTALLAKNNAVDPFKPYAEYLGLIHDIGKYALDFQSRINGNNTRFEHAICAAIELNKLKNDKLSQAFIPMFEYCVAGHHTGLPDGGSAGSNESSSDLQARLKREKYYNGSADYSYYKNEVDISLPELNKLYSLLTKDIKNNDKSEIIERYAFFTRYLFSCLTDADFIDTEKTFLPDTDRKLHADINAVIDSIGGLGAMPPSQQPRQTAQADSQRRCWL